MLNHQHSIKKNIITVLFYIVCVLTVLCFLNYYGVSDYEYVPKREIEGHLLKAISPKLVLDPKKPTCKYDYLENTNTLYSKKLPLEFEKFLPTSIVNGSYSPDYCNPLFSVALLVTYRNRQNHLNIFLPYIHNFLRRQNIHYKVYLIEQQDEKPWNKGSLYNIGAKWAIAEGFPCLVLHDVDLLPLDEANLYACLSQPRHMSVLVDRLRNVLPYSYLVGGAAAVSAHHYQLVNGFSNQFLGWGGEDDDFARRLERHDLKILRLENAMSRYTMLPHAPSARHSSSPSPLEARRSLEPTHDGLRSVSPRAVLLRQTRLFTLLAVNF